MGIDTMLVSGTRRKVNVFDLLNGVRTPEERWRGGFEPLSSEPPLIPEPPLTAPLRLFYSYSRKDERFRKDLQARRSGPCATVQAQRNVEA